MYTYDVVSWLNKCLGLTLFSICRSMFSFLTYHQTFSNFTFPPEMFERSSYSIFLPTFGILETSFNCSQQLTIFFILVKSLLGEEQKRYNLGDKEGGFKIYEHNSFLRKFEYRKRNTTKLTDGPKHSKKQFCVKFLLGHCCNEKK